MRCGYLVRFIRRDLHANEEYYYDSVEEALWHLKMFEGDDSGLYSRIEVVTDCDPEVLIADMKF